MLSVVAIVILIFTQNKSLLFVSVCKWECNFTIKYTSRIWISEDHFPIYIHEYNNVYNLDIRLYMQLIFFKWKRRYNVVHVDLFNKQMF